MKKIIFALTFFIAPLIIEAQVKTPQQSPKSTLTQMVGLTEVEINYSRPSTKGRPIFGDLVPFENCGEQVPTTIQPYPSVMMLLSMAKY